MVESDSVVGRRPARSHHMFGAREWGCGGAIIHKRFQHRPGSCWIVSLSIWLGQRQPVAVYVSGGRCDFKKPQRFQRARRVDTRGLQRPCHHGPGHPPVSHGQSRICGNAVSVFINGGQPQLSAQITIFRPL